MTISTNSLVEFFGDQTTLGNTSSAVADDGFSQAADLNSWTNTEDAPRASVVLLANWTTTAPDAGSSINLYARPVDIQSTNDQVTPDANFAHTYVGSFPVNNATGAQYVTIDISLINTKTAQEFEFYIENKSGSAESLPAGWDLYITPKTFGPKA